MTEHVHEWGIRAVSMNEPYAICECGKELEPFEIMRRLNATERLSAKEAKNIAAAGILLAGKVGVMGPLPRMAALFAYAAALEEK